MELSAATIGTFTATIFHVRCRVCASLIFVTALLQVRAAPVALTEVPFQFQEGLIWIEVNVPQSAKPLHFLLDTGAGASVINQSTAKRLGLELGSKVTVQGVGTTLPGYWLQLVSARSGDLDLPKKYLAVDLGKLSSSCKQNVDGLIGMDFFRDRVVQIDFDAQKVRLRTSNNNQEDGDSLPLQLRRCGMRLPISINGHKRQWVRLDTGCARSLQWVTSDVRPDQCTRNTAIGLAKLSLLEAPTDVEIGQHKFAKVPTGIHEAAIFSGEAGLLGNGLLSRFSSVTIDAKTGRVILKERGKAR